MQSAKPSRTTLQEAQRRAVIEILDSAGRGLDAFDVLVESLRTSTALRSRLTELEEASRTLLALTCGGFEDRKGIDAARELVSAVLDAPWPQPESVTLRDASRYVMLPRSWTRRSDEDDDTQPLPVCGACLRPIKDDESSVERGGFEWCSECSEKAELTPEEIREEKNIRRGEEEMQEGRRR